MYNSKITLTLTRQKIEILIIHKVWVNHSTTGLKNKLTDQLYQHDL